MHIFTIIFISIVVVMVLATLTLCLTEMRRLRARNLQIQATMESTRRVFNLFLHKLATEREIYDAMNIIAPQICEDLDAESVGIFVPQVIEATGELVLRGISCTACFPVLTGKVLTERNTKLYESLRFRMAFFRNEIIHKDEGILGYAFSKREQLLVNTDSLLLATYQLPQEIYTMMVLPLLVEDRFAGLICAVNRQHQLQPFDDRDMKAFKELSSTVALTSTLIIIYGERATQDRIKRELEFSIEIQKSLLPVIPPLFGDISIAPYIKSCNEVSGDFYDFLELPENRALIMVADATGKGIPACLLTSMCRSFVRSLSEHFTTLETFMLDLNRLVYANSDDSHYVTADVLLLDLRSNTCEIACAGHPPVLVAEVDGSVKPVKPAGAALGMWPKEFASFSTVKLDLEPGIKLCLFTDGINEALNKDNEEYGLERLKASWRNVASTSQTTDDAIKGLLGDMNGFVGATPQSDDQTIIVINRKKTNP